MTFKTRFAPSPTGSLHIGGARTALFCYLAAQHFKGKYVLRIEDTDVARSTDASVQGILESLKWLQLQQDEGPVYQMQRVERYQEVIQNLLDSGQAYRCFCSAETLESMRAEQLAAQQKPKYDGRCRQSTETDLTRPHVIRFKNPLDGTVVWNDLVKGEVRINNVELDDFIIQRSDGVPTYNFTVVVDDIDMQISHVIRGDDHVNNTPKQINLYQALGAQLPQFAHVPMILGEDGKRLSKRHGAVGVMSYREQGFLPDALLNYLLRLGFSYGDQEIFSREEMITHFDFSRLQSAAAIFDPDKLLWLNQHYLKTVPIQELLPEVLWHAERAAIDVTRGPQLETVIPHLLERAKTVVELVAQARYFYEDFAEFDAGAAKKFLRPVAAEPLSLAKAHLSELQDWSASEIHTVIETVASTLEIGMGKIGMPLRVAVTGGSSSPAIDITLALIGKERVLERISKALAFIEQRVAAG